MPKIYQVPVRRVCTDYAYIEAEDAEKAKTIAQELADNGTLETGDIMDGWEEQTAEEASEDTGGNERIAEANRDAYKELIDQRAQG